MTAEHDSGSTRISAVWHVPEVVAEFGIDLVELLETAGVRADLFDDRENRIAYPDFGRLLLTCERLSGCEHIVLLIAQRSRLADLGLPAQAALCSDTVEEALRTLAGQFTLHNTAAILSVITAGDFARFAYAIVAPDVPDTRPFQLGAMTFVLGVLRELCGPGFQPTVVTFASRGPADLRPLHRFFRAPLRFDSEESAVVFERHWLDRPLPPVDPRHRKQVLAEVRAQRELLMADFPAAVRRVLRKQLPAGDCSMDQVAGLLGMHRRTLDRHLQRHGTGYGDLVQAVKSEVAHQLLRDTDMSIRQVAEALRFSSAANFATAFRRWTGDTPSEFRRRAG